MILYGKESIHFNDTLAKIAKMNRFTVLESQNRPTINPYEEEGEERWRGGRGDKEGGVTGDAFLETLLLAGRREGRGAHKHVAATWAIASASRRL